MSSTESKVTTRKAARHREQEAAGRTADSDAWELQTLDSHTQILKRKRLLYLNKILKLEKIYLKGVI